MFMAYYVAAVLVFAAKYCIWIYRPWFLIAFPLSLMPVLTGSITDELNLHVSEFLKKAEMNVFPSS